MSPQGAKLFIARGWFSIGTAVVIYFDSSAADVEIPRRVRASPYVALRLMPGSEEDIQFDDRGVSATLSFGGEPHACRVPWCRVFAVRDEATLQTIVWPNSYPPGMDAFAVPQEAEQPGVAEEAEPQAAEHRQAAPDPATPPILTLVP